MFTVKNSFKVISSLNCNFVYWYVYSTDLLIMDDANFEHLGIVLLKPSRKKTT